MNTDQHDPVDAEHDEASQGIRSLSDAKQWLSSLARQGEAQVQIKEPYRELGGGLLVVTAILTREDGGKVNVEVYCYDDPALPTAKPDLFPLPPFAALSGVN